ncbi:MAG: polysaccharide deacetylase family protein [Candidatus Thorarchaeota archaeon]
MKRWGVRAPRQFIKMMSLHRRPFKELLENIIETLEPFDAKFAFPTVAAVASMRPDLVKMIVNAGHEVASHGFNHVRYPHISAEAREQDLRRSLHTFQKLGVKITGFRAPYDNYTDDMPELIDKHGLVWDGGFGYRPEHRKRTQFFQVPIDGRQSNTVFIPLNVWSDDRMIDTLGMSPSQITRRLKHEVKVVSEHGGVIMFDLHPIRIGQRKYVDCLRELVAYAQQLNGWCPTPTEAVRQWKQEGRWRDDASFCLLLTGDIDNWVFSDYLRRQIWKYYLTRSD